MAAVTNVPAPAAGPVTYLDASLKVNTAYRYRVFANRGGLKSTASSEAGVTTLNFGNASATISADIGASCTLYADTAYTLSASSTSGTAPFLRFGRDDDQGDQHARIVDHVHARLQDRRARNGGRAIVFIVTRAGQRQPGDWAALFVGNALNNRSGQVLVEGTGTDGTAIVSGKNYPVVYTGGTVATDNWER